MGKIIIINKLQEDENILVGESDDTGGTGTFDWGNIGGVITNQTDLINYISSYVSSNSELIANKGVANGYASLDSGGKVPSGQLPSYVDDVLEYANLASFPVTGESGKIYTAIDTGISYRWTGTVYTEVTDLSGYYTITEINTLLDLKENSLGYSPLESIVAGTNISINNTNQISPIINFVLGADENFVTDEQLTVIGNTSGTNTGDQDLSSYVTKTGIETLTNKTFDDSITQLQIATPTNPSSGYNKLYFKSDGKLYKLDNAGVESEVGGGAGLSWGASITGTSGTGFTSTIGPSATAGTIGYSGVIDNTQSGAHTLISLNTGTSAQAHKAINITVANASTSAYGININLGSTGTGEGMYITGTGTGIKKLFRTQLGSYNATNGTYGIKAQGHSSYYADLLHGNGSALYLGYFYGANIGGVGGIYLDGIGVNNGDYSLIERNGSSGNVGFIDCQRNIYASSTNQTNDYIKAIITRTFGNSGTLNDNFNVLYLKRNLISNGASSIINLGGAVAHFEDLTTQTAGTINNTSAVLKLTGSNRAIELSSGLVTDTAPVGTTTKYVKTYIAGVEYTLEAKSVA